MRLCPAILLLSFVFVALLLGQGHRALSANVTKLSPCSNEEVALFTISETQTMAVNASTGPGSLAIDGKGDLLSLTSSLGDNNVLGSQNVFFQTLADKFVSIGSDNILACSYLNSGTTVPAIPSRLYSLIVFLW